MSLTLPFPLIASGRALDVSETRLGWLTPTDVSDPVDVLRSSYEREGYLWLKHVIPSATITDFRSRYFAAFANIDLIMNDTEPSDGIASKNFSVNAHTRQLDNEIIRWSTYEALCLHPVLVELFEQLLGGAVKLLQRKMIRRTLPGSNWSTPAHYDLTYIRGGTDQSLRTAWIPLGDVPLEMGGLTYLEGSHIAGKRMEAEFMRKNATLPPAERISAFNRNMREGGWLTDDLPTLAEKLDARWLVANYEAGDIVIHSPYIIHAATTNRDPHGRVRLSTDIRYQLASEPADPRWGADWHHDDNL